MQRPFSPLKGTASEQLSLIRPPNTTPAPGFLLLALVWIVFLVHSLSLQLEKQTQVEQGSHLPRSEPRTVPGTKQVLNKYLLN